MNLNHILQSFKGVVQTGPTSWKALCPAHQDTNASLSITEVKDKVLIHCLAGCNYKDVLAAAGLAAKDLFSSPPAGQPSSRPGAGLPFKYGLTLAEYAKHRKFDPALLRHWGLYDGTYTTKKGQKYPGLAVPYKNAAGETTALRWRMLLDRPEKGPSAFLWNKGNRASLYGLWRLDNAEKSVILVEGESDCHALWSVGINALGTPGAGNYKPNRDDPAIEFFETIYVHLEKDDGGRNFFQRFTGRADDDGRRPPSRLLPKMLFFSLTGYKDPGEAWLHLHDKPEEFRRLIGAAIRQAKPAETFPQPECWKKPKPDSAKKDGRAVTSPINGEKGGRPQTDYIGLVDNYMRTFQDQSGQLTLRHWRNAWYQYNGRCYKPRLEGDIEGDAMAYLQNRDVASTYHVQPSNNALRNLLLGLRSSRCAGIPAETKAPSWLSTGEPADGWLAMRNTLISIEAAALTHYAVRLDCRPLEEADITSFTRPLTPDLLSTFSLDYDYDPFAQCPRFANWLATTQPDPDVQRAMMMLMGLALVPDTSYNVCFFLSGDGGTGKSTFLDILQALVGPENCCRVPLLKMEDRFSTWPLAENLLNIVGEMPTDDPQGRLRYIEGDFKDSISGGTITVERKGKDICTARCTARHVFATNSLPVFFDKSEGIWDRLVIIPFEQRFRGQASEVRNIRDTIIPKELPGIFNYALWGLAELRHHTRFPEPEACQAAKRFHRDRCDFDASYLRDNYHASDGAEISVSEAYGHYRTQLLANGLAPRSSPTFQQAVARIYGIRPTKRSQFDATRVFRGLAPNFAVQRTQAPPSWIS